jgi:tungstate transport system substrate-binding protein
MKIFKERNNVRMALLLLILGFTLLTTGCKQQQASDQTTQDEASAIVLATTTSTEQTGLLDAIIPVFTSETGIEVKVVAVGSGQALTMGETGEADVLLVHAKSSEEEFVEKGFGIERYDVMYNDFILVGPKDEEALPKECKADIVGALKYIQENKIPFISRGDDSGTHKKELSIWKTAGIEPSGDWYISAGKGMGEVLQMADEKKAYTLSDRGTFLSMEDSLELSIAVEKASDLLNQYGVIAVNPEKTPNVHLEEAQKFVDWILSEKTQKLIGEFGVEKYGQALFVPNAKA